MMRTKTQNHVMGLVGKGIPCAIAAILGMAAMGTASAEIVPLTTGNGVVNNGTLTFESGGRTISVVGGTYDDLDDSVALASVNPETTVVQTDAGLGLIRDGDTNPALSGFSFFESDLLIFEFDELVDLVSITFGNVDADDDFDLFLDTNGDGILERVARDILINNASGTLPGTSVAEVALAGLLQSTGTIFGIGADGFDDDFFISAITFAQSPYVGEVPIPGAIPLFLTGLAGLSFTRKKKMQRA